MRQDYTCRAYQAGFRGWGAHYIENGLVRLVAVPDIGGRVMAYDLGPYHFLYVDPGLAGQLFSPEENQGDGSLGTWKNYGGDKTWPAPQGWDTAAQWHGPPDPVLDSGRYAVEEFGCDEHAGTICMVSPPDERTGVQIVRRFTLGEASSRVRVDLTFRNVLREPIRWSIWDVAQLRAETALPGGEITYDPHATVTVPVNPESRFARGFNVMFGESDNPQWVVDGDLFRADYRWQIGKVGLDSTAGWIGFSSGAGYAFVEQFQYFPDAEYPDDGATVECWTVGAGQVANLNYADSGIYLMETEVLGPLVQIAPGGEATFAIQWAGCRCNGPVIDVQQAGCVARPLQAIYIAEGIQITGGFGVFDAGHLDLHWIGADGIRLTSMPVDPVSPLDAVALNLVLEPPEGARAIELWVTAEVDGVERRLAATNLG